MKPGAFTTVPSPQKPFSVKIERKYHWYPRLVIAVFKLGQHRQAVHAAAVGIHLNGVGWPVWAPSREPFPSNPAGSGRWIDEFSSVRVRNSDKILSRLIFPHPPGFSLQRVVELSKIVLGKAAQTPEDIPALCNNIPVPVIYRGACFPELNSRRSTLQRTQPDLLRSNFPKKGLPRA
jgi:hypothetical protein